PPGDGGPRALRPALPRVRRAGAADRLRGKRGELLPHVPDRWEAPGGPIPLPPVQARLAADAPGAGRAADRASSLVILGLETHHEDNGDTEEGKGKGDRPECEVIH